MRGDLVFDMQHLVVMKDRAKDIFYAIDKEQYTNAWMAVSDSVRKANREDTPIPNPEMEATIIVEREPRKFDLGSSKRVVLFNEIEGVLIGGN